MQIGINLFVIALQLRKEKTSSPITLRIAISIMMIWALRYFFIYIKFEDLVLNYPILLVFDQYLFLLDGLLLWLYSRTFITKKFSLKLLAHFIPFTVLTLIALFFTSQNPENTRQNFIDSVAAISNGQPIARPEVIIFFSIILLISIFYFVKSRKEVIRYRNTLKDSFSNIERINIDWVLTYQKLWLGLFIIPLIFYSLNYIYPTVSIIVSGSVLTGSMFFLSLYFNFHVLNQKQIKISDETTKKDQNLDNPATDEDLHLLDELYNRLDTERLYEDEQLSLNQLASIMSLKPVELTQLVKKSEYENFYDLINSFRVEAVKHELKNTSEQVIVIAYQCGFNSKSTFNKIFKKKTGMTPKEYRSK